MHNPLISVVSVSYGPHTWANLLVDSIDRFSEETPEIVIVDNSMDRTEERSINGIPLKHNDEGILYGTHTHGGGLNCGIRESTGKYVLLLDIDCHFVEFGWESALLMSLGTSHCLSVQGPPQKPLRPACVFMRREDALSYDWRATDGYKGHRVTPDGFDVGIRAYRKMIEQGKELSWLRTFPNRYGTMNGEEYGTDQSRYIYHHWHGTHLPQRQVDFKEDLIADKDRLFSAIKWRPFPKFF